MNKPKFTPTPPKSETEDGDWADSDKEFYPPEEEYPDVEPPLDDEPVPPWIQAAYDAVVDSN